MHFITTLISGEWQVSLKQCLSKPQAALTYAADVSVCFSFYNLDPSDITHAWFLAVYNCNKHEQCSSIFI